MDRVDRVLAIAADDQRYRWASAMIRTWKVGDVVVGVTKGRDISLLTVRDSTTVEDPIALARAIRSATAFARFRAPIAR